MPDEVRLGGGPYWYHDSLSDAELKALNPLPPKFDESLESLAERVRKLVGKVSVPRGLIRLCRKDVCGLSMHYFSVWSAAQ